jgi:hypothetical protein
MKDLLEILKYTIPSLVVLITVWVLVRHFLKNWENQRKYDTLRTLKKTTVPMQLQAYERITLLLERITVDSLLVREKDNSLNSRGFHQKLLTAIRSEYEHNLSQQIYCSTEAWQVVKNAKEAIIKMVNQAAIETPPEEPSIELSKKIIDLQMEINNSPTQVALEFINKEVKELLS